VVSAEWRQSALREEGAVAGDGLLQLGRIQATFLQKLYSAIQSFSRWLAVADRLKLLLKFVDLLGLLSLFTLQVEGRTTQDRSILEDRRESTYRKARGSTVFINPLVYQRLP
jgi:hypothetical protein